MSLEQLQAAFNPRSIAVVGASANPDQMGYKYISHLLDYGYSGQIYPIDPNSEQVLGLTAYPSLKNVPGLVDYVICCIRAADIPDLIKECPLRGVKVVHIYSGRLGESGNKQAIELEQEIGRQAMSLGIRLIGPNCLGIYNPRQGIAFDYRLPKKPGAVGGFFQTGGTATTFIAHASLCGVCFSKFASYGNAIDLNESDFLEYLYQDPETKIITAYIEGVRQAPRFFNLLRHVTSIKPVIILKGGRSEAGAKATVSHTASLAGSRSVWQIALKQAGAIEAQSLAEMIDIATAFHFLPPIVGTRVGIVGGAGGRGVISADACEEAGLTVVPLPSNIREEVKSKVPWLGDWVGNPADASIMDRHIFDAAQFSRLMATSPDFDFIIANVSDDNPFVPNPWKAIIDREVAGYIEVNKLALKPIAIVLDSGELSIEHFDDWCWRSIAEQRKRLINAQLPVFPTPNRAARAIRKMVDYYQRTKK